MIKASNLKKSFGNTLLFEAVDLVLEDTGFYLIMGESGCGKTTLLNGLYGLVPMDEGTICLNEEKYEKQVPIEEMKANADYITQMPFFVDFLNVTENLELVCSDKERIDSYLKQFGLENLATNMPGECSGGEKQRLAVVRALLSGKKILILDEPTASLDRDNKRIEFEYLKSIKQKVLIICSTHDREAEDYADVIFRFDRSRKTIISESKGQSKEQTDISDLENIQKKTPADPAVGYRYIERWFIDKHSGRWLNTVFLFLLTVSMLFSLFADLPENKVNATLANCYHINRLTVSTFPYGTWKEQIPKSEKIRSIVLAYNPNLPTDFEDRISGTELRRSNPYYIQGLTVIPGEASAFYLSDRLKFGSYFTAKDQAIITQEMAELMSPGDPGKLIGKKISHDLYGVGSVDLTIVGIFAELNENEMRYLDQYITSRWLYENSFFVPMGLIEPLESDSAFHYDTNSDRGRYYELYFDSFHDMKEYYDTYNDIGRADHLYIMEYSAGMLIPVRNIYVMMYPIALSVSILLSFLAVLFYLQLKRLDYLHRHSFISAYEYCGFDKSKVIHRFLILNIKRLFIKVIEAVAAALFFALTVNLLNQWFQWVPYQLFTFNYRMLIVHLLFLLAFSTCYTQILYRRVRVTPWYEDLMGLRDLM